jgi:hypothetical protein
MASLLTGHLQGRLDDEEILLDVGPAGGYFESEVWSRYILDNNPMWKVRMQFHFIDGLVVEISLGFIGKPMLAEIVEHVSF